MLITFIHVDHYYTCVFVIPFIDNFFVQRWSPCRLRGVLHCKNKLLASSNPLDDTGILTSTVAIVVVNLLLTTVHVTFTSLYTVVIYKFSVMWTTKPYWGEPHTSE